MSRKSSVYVTREFDTGHGVTNSHRFSTESVLGTGTPWEVDPLPPLSFVVHLSIIVDKSSWPHVIIGPFKQSLSPWTGDGV